MIYCALSLPESWDGGQRGLSDLIIKFAARGLLSFWKEATVEKANDYDIANLMHINF